MGVAGHQDVLVLVALLDEFVEEDLHLVGNLLEFMAGKEFEVYKYLIIAAAARMDLLTHVAEFAGEEHLHLGVHILHIVLYDKIATFCQVVDVLQLRQQLRQFILFQQPDAFQHRDVGHRA